MDGEQVAEEEATESEEGWTVAALWAAVEAVAVVVVEEQQVGTRRGGSWVAPSLQYADTAPSASPRAGASAGAAGSCRNSKAWRRGPRPTRSQQNRPGRCKCPATSPWRWRDAQRVPPKTGREDFRWAGSAVVLKLSRSLSFRKTKESDLNTVESQSFAKHQVASSFLFKC